MKGSDYVLINLIVFIICFVVGVYFIIRTIKDVKEDKNDTRNFLLALSDFVLAGVNLYLLITK